MVAVVLLAGCGDDETTDASPKGADGHGESSAVAEDARHIQVAGRSFEFVPDEIAVTEGDDIAIVLRSEDSLHDFTIDEFDAHIAAEGGDVGVGGFRAGEPGEYTFYCSVEGHREAGMEGRSRR